MFVLYVSGELLGDQSWSKQQEEVPILPTNCALWSLPGQSNDRHRQAFQLVVCINSTWELKLWYSGKYGITIVI